VLKTRIPERKFDFGLDFLVVNELATNLYAMARGFPVDSPERKEWLSKAIATYHKSLSIDSEDVAAHYGLGLAFGDPAWGSRRPDTPPAEGQSEKPLAVAPDDLAKLGSAVADLTQPVADRREKAIELARAAGRYMREPRPRFQSLLEPLHDISTTLGPVWEREGDEDTKLAIGRVLEVTHKALHERLKPDETAEGRAFAIARKDSPAANMNAQSIVIHPLQRPGAPGIDAPAATGTAAATAIAPPPVSVPETQNPTHAHEGGQ
jgi:hypothetical protein